MELTWPKGVELNGKQIRISFMLDGKRYKEPIGNEKVDQASIKYAESKRNIVLSEIKMGGLTMLLISQTPSACRLKR